MKSPARCLLVLLLSCVVRPLLAAEAPDFSAAQREMVGLLKDFVRLQTFAPAGNETQAAKLLQGVLASDGITAEIFEKESGRGNLVARLKGSGKKRPLLLMGHLDTVGVERSKWTVEPFEPVEKEGYLYGRGTTDDKTGTVVFLQEIGRAHV